ncbi:MAG: hypothetical protein ACREXS_18680 [Gammaproteobacteria bacterium]
MLTLIGKGYLRKGKEAGGVLPWPRHTGARAYSLLGRIAAGRPADRGHSRPGRDRFGFSKSL